MYPALALLARLTFTSVGDLRFRLPVAPDPYEGAYNATAFGPACPQQVPPNFIPPGFEVFQEVYEAELANPLGDGAEDCKYRIAFLMF